MWESLAKMLLLAGGVLVVLGALLLAAGKLTGLSRLPGDIFIQKENFTFYFPVMTCIVLSLLLTIIINLIRK